MVRIVIRIPIRRGSVYLIVLAVSMMVTVIGLASLFAVRAQRRSAEIARDCAEALLYAQSAVELGLLSVQDPNWRVNESNGIWLSNQPLGSGLFTLEGIDPYDSVLNDSNMDPLVLIGTGEKGFARQKMQVRLVAEVPGLSCLEVALHAQNDVFFNSATVNCDQKISSNNSVSAISSTINADTEALNAISGSTYNGTTMFPVPAKEMPDSTVFDYYLANGTYIDVLNLPLSSGYRYMEAQVLSPALNPYDPNYTNSEGIYVINCAGENIAIQNCRIVGTLVLLDPNECEVHTVNWEPAVANYPALMVQGSAEFYCNTSSMLEEGSSINVNFNPEQTPYPNDDPIGWDTDTSDSYSVVIRGLVYVSSNVNTWQSPAFDGVVVVGNTTTVNASLDLTYDSTFFSNPPPGFEAPVQMKISPGSWKRVVE